jgi:hypothetical protein
VFSGRRHVMVASMRRLTRRCAVATGMALAIVGSTSVPAALAAQSDVWAGECVMTWHVTYSFAVFALPGANPTVHVDASGSCVLNGIGTTATLVGDLGPIPPLGGMGCLVGTAAGVLTLTFSNLAFPRVDVTVGVVAHGASVAVDLNKLIWEFRGVGVLAQDTSTVQQCAVSFALASATWTGVVLMEDPRPP